MTDDSQAPPEDDKGNVTPIVHGQLLAEPRDGNSTLCRAIGELTAPDADMLTAKGAGRPCRHPQSRGQHHRSRYRVHG